MVLLDITHIIFFNNGSKTPTNTHTHKHNLTNFCTVPVNRKLLRTNKLFPKTKKKKIRFWWAFSKKCAIYTNVKPFQAILELNELWLLIMIIIYNWLNYAYKIFFNSKFSLANCGVFWVRNLYKMLYTKD